MNSKSAIGIVALAARHHTTENELLLRNIERLVRPLAIIPCPREGCRYAASALREGRALRNLAAHLVRVHHPREGRIDGRS